MAHNRKLISSTLKAAYEQAESIAAKQNDYNEQRYDMGIGFSQLSGDR